MKTAKCPICGKKPAADFRPFCSQACADRDLAQWLTGGYRVASEEGPQNAVANDVGPPTDYEDD